MPACLTDDPAITISVSMDRYTLDRLNTAARLCLEANSRSELVRDLLNLALDTLLEPEIMLPIILESVKAQRRLEAATAGSV